MNSKDFIKTYSKFILVTFIVILVVCYVGIVVIQNIFSIDQFTQQPITTMPRQIEESSLPTHLLWKVELDGVISQNPILSNDGAIVITNNKIYKLDTVDGQVLWSHELTARLRKKPLVEADKLIYGDSNGRVFVLDLKDGSLIWQHNIGEAEDNSISSFIIEDGVVYVATQPTEIEARDLSTGERIWHLSGWQQNIPDRAAKLFLVDEELYLFTTEFHVLDLQTGAVIRAERLNVNPSQLVNGQFFASEWVRDAQTLEVIMPLSPQGNCKGFKQPYTFFDDYIFGAGSCGGVFAIDIATYKIKWTYRSEIMAHRPVAVYKDQLYILFEDGEIHAVNLRTGSEQGILIMNKNVRGLTMNASPASRGLIANNNILIATFNDQNVWAFCEDPCFESDE